MSERWNVIGFLDDSGEKQCKAENGIKVFGREALELFPEARILAVPGSPLSFRSRRQVIESLGLSKERFATIVHPSAVISSMAVIGFNVLIYPGVVLSGNPEIGNHICILSNSVIHHDSSISDWTLIGSNVVVAGNVRIGKNCYIASGSCIRDGVTIGDNCLVGMGSVVLTDVPSDSVVAGNPARPLTKK
jgi:sugar O-acyltransferase (sialic acid O-acetyltransferase NeuD family)